MEQEKVLLTQSGLEKLEQERDRLINVERPKVIEELQLARSQGDLSENADYDAAREKQGDVDIDINDIITAIPNAEHISENETGKLLEYEDSVLLFMSPNDLTSFEQDYINKYHEVKDNDKESN